MARNISRHARYRLGSTALAVSGGLLCLGAFMGRHEMLLVVGMMNLAARMLVMSLRPPKEVAQGPEAEACDRCPRAQVKVKLASCSVEPAEMTTELRTDAGRERPRERKNRTWSI